MTFGTRRKRRRTWSCRKSATTAASMSEKTPTQVVWSFETTQLDVDLSTQQMTSIASREGEKKWSASMVCAVSIFPLNRIFLFWGIKFLVHQKIASVPPDHPHSCNWRVWNIHSPRWWSWWVWLWRRRQQRRGRGGRTWRCWKCLIRSCRQKYPRINLRKYVFQPLIAGKNFWNHMNQNNIAAWM